MSAECLVFQLGLVEYGAALNWQQKLVALRAAGQVPDLLLLLEHPPVFTVGASGGQQNLPRLVGAAGLSREGIPLLTTDRGGDITYHGPGQLVCYPILDLGQAGLGIPDYVRRLEAVAIATLKHFSIAARHLPGLPGVWVGAEKVCAIGLRVSRGISYHGFALNVNNDLLPFSYIFPCGIRDKGVTSLSLLLGRKVETSEVVAPLLSHFTHLFQRELEPGDPLWLKSLATGMRGTGAGTTPPGNILAHSS